MAQSPTLLVFPHQLFANHPGLAKHPDRVMLVEDDLFFGDAQYPARFHKQKLWLHKASMQRFRRRLEEQGLEVDYFEHRTGKSDGLESVFAKLAKRKQREVVVSDPHDFMLRKRLLRHGGLHNVSITFLETPMFLNTPAQNKEYRDGKKRWFMADYYKHQRRRLDVLMEEDGPVGGQWSYDKDNRKKVPKKMLGQIPRIPQLAPDDIELEARRYILETYPDNPGSLQELYYPTSHEGAERWLEAFLTERFALFGDYEDAMVRGERFLWHAVITPMLNVGLLTPRQVLEGALQHGEKGDVPLNALEGFVRQVIGWREFMRATYEDLGVSMRTTNHWGHTRPIPESFYTASTGIDPIDDTIRRILETGYCHHIERLMVLGGFMFLCEFDPDDIYRWFMEMFVDSYDWVMVPNVYAMSQHADGGQITTKPYFSGSSYVRKMSNHPTGDWAKVWDGLYWRWIWNHAEELSKNPRWAMMCAMARKMDPAKRDAHIACAEEYMTKLDAE